MILQETFSVPIVCRYLFCRTHKGQPRLLIGTMAGLASTQNPHKHYTILKSICLNIFNIFQHGQQQLCPEISLIPVILKEVHEKNASVWQRAWYCAWCVPSLLLTYTYSSHRLETLPQEVHKWIHADPIWGLSTVQCSYLNQEHKQAAYIEQCNKYSIFWTLRTSQIQTLFKT